mmetsp:Transcript_58834/g.179428  ORF Transcript_58834/g.179428 Transcript_58834/m.179428 type:complete len:244 (+) Transcript_58834:407-1138(+)
MPKRLWPTPEPPHLLHVFLFEKFKFWHVGQIQSPGLVCGLAEAPSKAPQEEPEALSAAPSEAPHDCSGHCCCCCHCSHIWLIMPIMSHSPSPLPLPLPLPPPKLPWSHVVPLPPPPLQPLSHMGPHPPPAPLPLPPLPHSPFPPSPLPASTLALLSASSLGLKNSCNVAKSCLLGSKVVDPLLTTNSYHLALCPSLKRCHAFTACTSEALSMAGGPICGQRRGRRGGCARGPQTKMGGVRPLA